MKTIIKQPRTVTETENEKSKNSGRCPNCGKPIFCTETTKYGMFSFSTTYNYSCNKCGCEWDED